MKILVFGQSWLSRFGGVARFYARLYTYLASRGHTITHAHFLPHGYRPFSYPHPAGIKYRGVNIYANGDIAAKFREIALDEDPDVILLVGCDRWNLDALAGLSSTPFPVIVSEHGCPEYVIHLMWRSRRSRELLIGNTEYFHTLLPGFKKSLPKSLHDRIEIIGNPEPEALPIAAPAAPNAQGEFIILYTGRFAVEKQLPLLIEAFAMLARDFPAWRLCFVGAGPKLSEMQAAIARFGVTDRIAILPSAESPEALANYYGASHIFSLPSNAEGCPYSLLEAFAHGLPAVGFESCPGVNEIIEDGYNGYLAKENSAACLADKLRELMRDPEKRASMGANARASVARFAPEAKFAQWEALLQKAAKWKGKKRRLRLTRALRHPFASLWRKLQGMPVSSLDKRDLFATSPFDWLRQLRGHFVDYALLNFFRYHPLARPQAPAQILAEESRLISELKQPESEAAAIARNMVLLANRFDINLKNLYNS